MSYTDQQLDERQRLWEEGRKKQAEREKEKLLKRKNCRHTYEVDNEWSQSTSYLCSKCGFYRMVYNR